MDQTQSVQLQQNRSPSPDEAGPGAPVLSRFSAFDLMNLSLLAPADAGIMLKTQHSQILSVFDEIERSQSDRPGEHDDKFLRARNLLTTLAMMLTTHFSMEDSLLVKQMAGDAKKRLLATQFERDCGNLKAEFSEFAKRYPTASALRRDAAIFIEDLIKLRRMFSDAFRTEERDIYVGHDEPSRA